MSDELDRRIRELFTEADRVAPEAPRSPDFSRERTYPVRWSRWVLIPAASMIVLLAGVAVVFDALGVELGLGLAGSADEGADLPPGDVDLATVLAELNLTCIDLAEEVGEFVLTPADDAEAFDRLLVIREGLDDLGDQFESATYGAPDDADLERAREEFEVLEGELDMAIGNGIQGALDHHVDVVKSLGRLGDSLATAGALECAPLP